MSSLYLFHRTIIKYDTETPFKDNNYSTVMLQEISYEQNFHNFFYLII